MARRVAHGAESAHRQARSFGKRSGGRFSQSLTQDALRHHLQRDVEECDACHRQRDRSRHGGFWIANFADLIIVMTNGGPADQTQIVSSYIFTQAFKALDFGYASAIALVLLALLLAYSMLIILLRQTLLNRD